MNKCKRMTVARLLLAIGLLFSVNLSRPLTAAADETDLYHESLKFDSDGNLLMTTRDKKAAGTVRYKTIGWTMKRTGDASTGTQCVRLKLEQSGASRPDPADLDYVFTYFKCDRSLIFAEIGAVSADWQKELYQNGGIVYLDAIMTVVENGKAMGSMDENGILHGEVYTTAAGIMNARDWADAQVLRTHFHKAVSFPPLPGMLPPEEEVDEEDLIRIAYGQEECRTCSAVRISASPGESPAFDATKGIPTGEDAFVIGQLQKYYYEGTLVHCYGTVPVPVEFSVTYTYPIKTEKGISTGSFTNTLTYYVNRPYSYYKISELQLYALEHVVVENKALPVVPLECRDLYTLHMILESDRDSYIQIPTYGASVYGGDLSSGACISGEELSRIAQNTAGNVWVRNDELMIDGEVVLNGSYMEAAAPEPKRLHGERLQPFRSEDMTIPDTKRNDSYDTYAAAFYQDVLDQHTQSHVIKHVNAVVVHTPVVCKGGITDDTAHNQQIHPTTYMSLVLGRDFTVGISMVGTHRDQKGYKTRDYEKYTAFCQIRFPFEVYNGRKRYAKDTWIDLPKYSQTFYLPVGVREGDYKVRYRTIAKNASAMSGGIDLNGYLANLELSDYGAYDELTVTVIGRMYDLAVTDIVDYPRWRSVFYEPDGWRRRYAFLLGANNLEGEELSERAAQGMLPILPGDHPFNRSARAVGLGYRVHIQLKTIGDMRETDDYVILIPTYYYISRDGSRRLKVHLYRKKDLSKVFLPLVLTALDRSYVPVENRNVSDPVSRAQSVQVWEGAYQLSPDLYLMDADIDLDDYIRQRGGRIGQRDPVFLRDGYLLVQFEIRTYPAKLSGTGHLSYANISNDAAGYCNMWRLQGFSYERTDCFGNRFVFADGDCLLFDTKYSLHSDYESWGTH